jgi:hypothetical protein
MGSQKNAVACEFSVFLFERKAMQINPRVLACARSCPIAIQFIPSQERRDERPARLRSQG